LSLSESAIQKAQKYELLDPDVRLMLQVRDDNATAFEELVEKYQARLVGVLEHIMPVREGAEDLAQEVFMRVYRARKTYIPGAKFSTWLFTIANNVACNAMRKMSRRKEVNVQATPSGSVPVRPLENMAKDASGLMPTRLVDKGELSDVVRVAMQSLNDRQRMALLLSKFEGMSYQDIAEAMGITTQAVKSLLSRARVNLKNILEPYIQFGSLPPGELNDPVSENGADPGLKPE
jgi:RNA polymerase sigma-70 factor (ECF subfamily)